jgi:integrase/recombinase XerD
VTLRRVGSSARSLTLPIEAEEFCSWLVVERGRAPSTLAAYRKDLEQYVAWLGTGALADVDAGTIERYVEHLRTSGRAPSTVARATVVVRSLHRFLAEEGTVTADAGADVATPRVPAGLPKPLTEDEVTALLDAVVGHEPVHRRDRALLELLYATGARISEAVGLDLADVDIDAGLVRLFGKGSKERIVPFGRLARAAMGEWLSGSGRAAMIGDRPQRRDAAAAVFLNQRAGRLTRQGAWLVIGHHAGRAGIGDRMSPHVLRHSCATHLLEHGADVRVVQELLGHARVSTTQVYTQVSPQRLRAVFDAAHPRARA